MKKLVVSSVVMLLALCLCGCAAARSSYTGDVPQFSEPASGAQTAVFDTSYGTFTAVLYPEYAPKTVANFIALAEKGYYNGLSFHRVVSDLCIQSGDPTGTGTGGETADGAALQNEFTDELRNYRGALGMAASDDGVIGSQFYIVTSGPVDSDTEQKLADAGVEQGVIDVYKREGGAPHLDFRYTVFGQVYSGMDVVEKIGAIKTDSQNRPKKDVIINSVTISAYVPADQN